MDEVKRKKYKTAKHKKSSSRSANEEDYERKKISNKEFKKIRQKTAEDQDDWDFWQEYYKK